MLDPHREIQALVDNFIADLSDLAKRIAIEQLRAAFGVGAKLAGTKLPPLPMPAPAAAPARASRGRRGRRGPRDIEALRGKLLSVITENPGRRAEDISAALGTKTAEIAPPLRRLVADRVVRTEGARRGTRYYLASPPDAQNGRRAEPPVAVEEPTS
ncbi:MAG TPA: hypothetical protein VLM79_33700 [Kofleriaceae bacterium]|nr:hypothetical protein [Kofleriaceae bacterium]